MDWLMIAAIAIGVWMLLLVLSGERISQTQRLAMALAAAQSKKEDEIPIATDAPRGGHRKR